MADVNLNVNLNSMAEKLLDSDADKTITKNEIKLFVQANQAEFVSMNMDTDTAVNGLMDVFTRTQGKVEDDTTPKDAAQTEEAKKEETPADEFNRLKGEIEEYTQQIEDLDNTLDTLTANQADLKDELDQESNKYSALEEQLIEENAEYKKIIDKINQATEAMEEEVAAKQKKAIWDAMSVYNQEEDGDWNEFLAGYLEKADTGSSKTSALMNLFSKADFMETNLNYLGAKLSQQENVVKNTAADLDTVTDGIKNTEATKETTTAALNQAQTDLNQAVLNLVSEAEMNLAEENNLDLTEQLPDGRPRYIFAKGKQDGEYHIYDMSCNASLARQYGKDDGGLRGDDIVPSGNGYINGYSPMEGCSEGGEEVFYLTPCGTMETEFATYTTSSPLSFDLNGDGVKTSNKVVDFDIDGDGKVDKINDSSDAVLVFDKDGDGISGADGSECFGDNTDLDGDGVKDGYADGFEALKALAQREGLINGTDDNTLDANDLKYLEENFGLKMKTGGYNSEAQSLADIGITEINLAQTNETTLQDNFDGNGNQLMTQQGATFKVNGETREYADIWHRKLDETPDKAQKANIFEDSSSALSFDASKTTNKVEANKREADEAIENSRNIMKKLFGKNIR